MEKTKRTDFISPVRLMMTACAQCGYRFEKGDVALEINETGDVIHDGCRMDYFEDNIEEFSSSIEL